MKAKDREFNWKLLFNTGLAVGWTLGLFESALAVLSYRLLEISFSSDPWYILSFILMSQAGVFCFTAISVKNKFDKEVKKDE